MASHSCLLSCDKLAASKFCRTEPFQSRRSGRALKFSAWVRRHPVRILARRLGDHSADPVFTSKRQSKGSAPCLKGARSPHGRPVVVTRTKNNYFCGL